MSAAGRVALRRGLGVVGVLGLALGCAACSSGSSADALGHRACVEVASSIKLFNKAAGESANTASATRAHALTELRDALQPAALASSSDTDWQALTATLSESSHVAEAELVPALTAQCAATLQEGSS